MKQKIRFEPLEATDWRGQKYGIGDLILYPRIRGSSAEICEAIVERIYYRKSFYSKKEELRVQVRPTGKGSRGFHRTTSRTVYMDAAGRETSYDKAAEDTEHSYKTPRFNRESGAFEEVTVYPRLSRQVPVRIKLVTLNRPENVTLLKRYVPA